LSERKVQAIVLCGQDETQAALARSIEAELSMPVQLFDPFAGFERGSALRGAPVEHPGRFAPLLGICQAELRQAAHAVDFLHPRRHAEPPNRRKTWIMAASAAGFLLLAYLVYARIASYVLVGEVEELTKQKAALDTRIEKAKDMRDTVAAIAKWADDDTVWLDQLLAISQGFPSSREVILNDLAFDAPQAQHEGRVTVRGFARDPDVVKKMEERAKARAGQILSKNGHYDESTKDYHWWFDAEVQFGRRPKL
jgi:hypothetical protein